MVMHTLDIEPPNTGALDLALAGASIVSPLSMPDPKQPRQMVTAFRCGLHGGRSLPWVVTADAPSTPPIGPEDTTSATVNAYLQVRWGTGYTAATVLLDLPRAGVVYQLPPAADVEVHGQLPVITRASGGSAVPFAFTWNVHAAPGHAMRPAEPTYTTDPLPIPGGGASFVSFFRPPKAIGYRFLTPSIDLSLVNVIIYQTTASGSLLALDAQAGRVYGSTQIHRGQHYPLLPTADKVVISTTTATDLTAAVQWVLSL